MKRIALGAMVATSLALAPCALASDTIGNAGHGSGGSPCTYGGTMIQRTSPGAQYAAPYDGIITAWTSAGSFPSMTLKVARLGPGDSFTVIAADGPRAFALDEFPTYPVRIAVRQGDVIGAYGAVLQHVCGAVSGYSLGIQDADVPAGQSSVFGSSSVRELDVAATIELDGDGDGYGDETQDQCPTSGATAGPCPLPTVLGETFDPITTHLTGDVVKTATPGVIVAAQEDGVITSWSYQANSIVDGTIKLKMFRPLGGNDYRVVGVDQPRVPVANSLNTFETRIPVRQGDKIGVHPEDVPVASAVSFPENSTAFFDGDLAVGSSETFLATTGRQIDISAVLEADADGDGYGDTSQDACPTDASTQGECPAAQPPADPPANPPADTPTAACDAAHDKLANAKAKLKKLKHKDATQQRIERAKKKVKSAKDAVEANC
jgi:hypothetical protein